MTKGKTCMMVLLITLLIILPTLASGHIYMRIPSVEELADSADLIVTAYVVGNSCTWNTDHDKIYTYTAVAVDEVIKSDGFTNPNQDILLKLLGGRVDSISMMVTGVPSYGPDEYILLFLRINESTGGVPQNYVPYYREMGSYYMVPGPTMEECVYNDIAWETHTVAPPEAPAALRGVIQTLDDFITEIESFLTK
jgi:hypothetical protein